MTAEALRPTSPAAPVDMGWCVEHVHACMCGWQGSTHELEGAARVAERAGLVPRGQGRPEVVLAGDVACELGAPDTESRTAIIVTRSPGLVSPNTVSVFGYDLNEHRGKLPFAQVLMIESAPETWPDPFDLDRAQYLTHRLRGFMTRSVPGRLWIRVSNSAIVRGLRLRDVGASLITACLEVPAVRGVEVVLATDAAVVESLAPVCLEAEVLSGRHRKLALSVDGQLDCEDLSCETCEERPVCDGLRDMLAERRRNRNRGES